MAYSNETLNHIYDRTSGNCHLCHKKLAFTNYARHSAKGAWEVEHSIPKARGGTDHGNNLFAAHISCNRSKSARSTRSARSQRGHTRAPYSKATARKKRNQNTLSGAAAGGLIGSIFGPGGTAVGSALGALIGNASSKKK